MTTYLGWKVIYHRQVPRTGVHLWTSPLYTTHWEPNKTKYASCDNRHLWGYLSAQKFGAASPEHEAYWHSRHKSPAEHCNCGFHATWDINDAAEWLNTQAWKFEKTYFQQRIHAVLAVVEGGGTVEQHETGFRAEQMLIKGVTGWLDPTEDGFKDAYKSGLTVDVVKPMSFIQNFPEWDLGYAILAVSGNKRTKKIELDDEGEQDDSGN